MKYLLPLCLGIVISIMLFLQNDKQTEVVKNVTKDLAEYDIFQKYIDTIKVNTNNSNVIIEIRLQNKYDDLTPFNQFGLLEFFTSQLRQTLRYLEDKNEYHSSNYKIVAHSKSQEYKYSSKVRNKYDTNLRFTSTLFLDEEQIYTCRQFKNELQNRRKDLSIENFEKEIIAYAGRLFNNLTNNGKTYRPEQDLIIIESIVSEKFSISIEEYRAIYRKIFVLNDNYCN